MSLEQSFRKELVYPGKGEIPQFKKNSKAVFHFRTYKPILDGQSLSVRPDPDEVIDDTRAMGIGPFELIMGREFKLDVWDEMIRTMQLNEVAVFLCPFKKVMEYPRVSRALRELVLEKSGKNIPHHHHHCSFGAMQGTGHPDLDKILEERLPLCFELELIRVEQPGEYKQESWAMNDAEKETAIKILREEGNTLYKEGKYSMASEKYFEALSYLEEQLIREKPHAKSWHDIAKRKVPLLLNYAQCKLLMKEYTEVIRHTTSVLEIEDDNVKALYRRGKAHSARWDVQEAEEDLKRAAKLDASLVKAVEKELRSLTLRVKQNNVLEMEKLKGKMFV